MIKFYRSLMVAMTLPIVAIIGVAALYIVLMSLVNHRLIHLNYFIVVFALIKTYFIAFVTFKHLSKLVKSCYSFKRLFLIFGLLIFVTVVSFALDHTCLYEYQHTAFAGVVNYSNSYITQIPAFVYFSVTTFATVGFGDIVPVSSVARVLVLLEIFLSFLIIVFALANINKIHINK